MILPLLKPIFLFNSLKLAQFFYIKQRMELLCLLQVYKLVVTCYMFESFQFLIIFFLSNLGPFLASSICECQHSKWWRKKFCAWNWHQGQNLRIGGQKSQDKYDTRQKRKSTILETNSFVLDAGIVIVFQCL